ncbi:MAG: hypothetical protein HUJ26_15780 [Planctomycetaceae bacterium]|nr:hypothetical protein [Planctomycetaceae bacterium]
MLTQARAWHPAMEITMSDISENKLNDMKIMLKIIMEHNDQWNWYKVSRACFGRLSSPANLDLKELLQLKLVEEVPANDGDMSCLSITEHGKAFLVNNPQS